MVFNIQVLRAFAASLVVHAHAAGTAGLKLAWSGGASGVDLFFVISGFIITYVAQGGSNRFMTRRLIRIVPIYWASTLTIYVLVLVMPHAFRTVSADPVLLVRSLLFLPTAAGVHTSDGLAHPTLAGGWTLNYEMYFYVMFWVGLTISKKWASLISVLLLAGVMVVVNLTTLHRSPVAYFYGYPIVIEFAYGVAAFHVVHYLEAPKFRAIWPRFLDAVLAVLAATGLACLAFNLELFGPGPRWFYCGIPAFVVLVSAVLLERVHGLKVTNKLALLVGDASYVLYLLHAYVVFGVLRLVIGPRTFSEPAGQLVTLGLVGLSIIAAILVYRYFEAPLLRRLKAVLLPRTR